MNSVVSRHASLKDKSALEKLWLTVYPGDAPYASVFFTGCFHPEDTCVIESAGVIRSMFFSLKGCRFHAGNQIYSASYLYALGTDPLCRGEGFGRKLTSFTAEEDYRQNVDFVFLNPATPQLREWYRDTVQAEDVFMERRIDVEDTVPDVNNTASDVNNTASDGYVGAPVSAPFGVVPACSVSEITPEAYLSLRALLLKNTCHMELPLQLIRLQAEFCRLSGGGLYEIHMDGAAGICLGDIEEHHLVLRELLFPEGDPRQAAQLIMQKTHCSSAAVRTPAFWHEGLGRLQPTCMRLKGSRIDFPKAENPYWGFLLD